MGLGWALKVPSPSIGYVLRNRPGIVATPPSLTALAFISIIPFAGTAYRQPLIEALIRKVKKTVDPSKIGVYLEPGEGKLVRITSPYWIPEPPEWVMISNDPNVTLLAARGHHRRARADGRPQSSDMVQDSHAGLESRSLCG